MKFITFFSLFFISLQSIAMPLDVHGYLRSGTGNNLQGGAQNCFNNPGSEGNEFRLGNECGIYGETTFSLDFLEKNTSSSNFKVQTTLAFFPNANTQYGDETNYNDVDIVEAFAEAKNLEGVPYTYWVGKRFYRDVDVYMSDFYYFAAMNGVGAGAKDIPLFSGKFSIAYLQEKMTSTTVSDQIVKSFLDFRLFGIQAGSIGELNFWSSFGKSPSGHIGTKKYENVSGALLGIRIHNNIQDAFNDFAIIYGTNLMSAMSVYGDGEVVANVQNDKRTKLRAVEHLTKKVSDKVELHASSTLELRNNGNKSSHWWNLGFRPIYLISDHLRFVTELGHSEVNSSTSSLTLSRLTFAYEIALNKSIWARPVLRAYASESIWNKANRANFQNKKDGHTIGFQAEAWF